MSGKIIIPANVNVWPHELKTAQALIRFGYSVEFKMKAEGHKVHSADAYINGQLWEFKAPKSSKLDSVERNLRRASHQSCFIVFDSVRMKKIPDHAVMRELSHKAPLVDRIKKVIFVNRKRECIDIFSR